MTAPTRRDRPWSPDKSSFDDAVRALLDFPVGCPGLTKEMHLFWGPDGEVTADLGVGQRWIGQRPYLCLQVLQLTVREEVRRRGWMLGLLRRLSELTPLPLYLAGVHSQGIRDVLIQHGFLGHRDIGADMVRTRGEPIKAPWPHPR